MARTPSSVGMERPSLANGINQNRTAAQVYRPARHSLRPHGLSSSKYEDDDSTGAVEGSTGGALVGAGPMSPAGVSVRAASLVAAGASSTTGAGAISRVGSGATPSLPAAGSAGGVGLAGTGAGLGSGFSKGFLAVSRLPLANSMTWPWWISQCRSPMTAVCSSVGWGVSGGEPGGGSLAAAWPAGGGGEGARAST